MTLQLHVRLLVPAVLGLLLAACGGGGSETSAATPTTTTMMSTSIPVATEEVPATGVMQLQRYRIDPAKVFVAGISSGGFAAVQMHMAHSATFKGSAIYAGGVYWCAGTGGAATALANCGGLTLPTGAASYNSMLAASNAYLEAQSGLGTIDPIANLAGQPVYLWSGTQDQTVHPKQMADLAAQYRRLGANVRFDDMFPAAHGWESPEAELDCGTPGSPFMVRCSANGVVYDSVRTWLTLFLGALNPRNDGRLHGSLRDFDQTEFGASQHVSMNHTGKVFVPRSCAQGRECGFVLALHGCRQYSGAIGDRWVTQAGINEWADTNGLVVLYPDTIASSAPGPTNPNGCWDWWGYSNQVDPNYALKSGLQMSVLHAMVRRVTGLP